MDGIYLVPSSNNTITRNNITANTGSGIWTGGVSNNITGNHIANNNIGILFHVSHDLIYNNNFINNTKQVEDICWTNPWLPSSATILDDGYPSGGNYWSDYNGTDADQDGIGDSPYVIDANNQDNYPLMGMFSDFNATLECHVQTISNSTISDFQFNGTAISFNVTGETDITGFCRICIPRALMNETYQVFVNGTEVPCNLLPCSNSTHCYLYFTYNHSTQEVMIVPEFPTWTSMLLILIVLTVATVIYKRRLPKTPIH